MQIKSEVLLDDQYFTFTRTECIAETPEEKNAIEWGISFHKDHQENIARILELYAKEKQLQELTKE